MVSFFANFLVIGGVTLLAQAKIGVFNSPAILEKSVEGNRVIAQMTADLDKKQTERKRLAEDAYSYMDELQKRLFKKVTDELSPLIEQIGKEKGLDIIFDLQRARAAWFNPTIDITGDVIKRYDAVKSGQIK